jgi:hypothetical protein
MKEQYFHQKIPKTHNYQNGSILTPTIGQIANIMIKSKRAKILQNALLFLNHVRISYY